MKAMHDWNHNGKTDAFDLATDYMMYREFVEETEVEEESSDFDWEYYHTLKSTIATAERDRENLFAMSEVTGKSTESILRTLILRKRRMDRFFEKCSIESGFLEVMDNTQMYKDFWLHLLTEVVETGGLNKVQRISVIQLLLDAFDINNPMDASNHYQNLETNSNYRDYIESCFGVTRTQCKVAFWVIFGCMSGNDGERIDLTVGFLNEFIKFTMHLEYYLSRMFAGKGFGNSVEDYLKKRVRVISEAIDGDSAVFDNVDLLINPIYPVFKPQ